MKYVKMLGLLAVAAAALMAFAGPASATVVKSAHSVYTGGIKAEAVNPPGVTLHSTADVTCTGSVIEGNLESHGAAATAKGKITKLTFSGCNQHVVPLTNGSLEAHTTKTPDATLTSSGTRVTVQFTTIFGNIHCIFATNNTHIGTVTGATTTTGHAVLDIEATIPVESGPCSPSQWTGKYTVVSPKGLTFH